MKDLIEKAKKKIPGANIEFGNSSNLKINWIDTGIPILNNLLGSGIPRGRVTLFVGPYGGGKTFTTQVIMGKVQRNGGIAAYIDVERGYDPDWFKKSGVKIEELFVSQPTSGEIALDTVLFLIEEGIDIIVLDSIAALVPSEELEKNMEQFTIGAQARMFNKGLRKVIQAFTNRAHELGSEKNSAFIAVNQVRSGIGGPITFETYPAGKGQQSFASIIMKVHRGPWHHEGKEVGFEISCKTEKNKLATPFQNCSIPFKFTGEVDVLVGLIDLALNVGIIQQRGPYFQYGDFKVQGKLGLINYIKDNNLQEEIQKALRRENV